MPDMRSYYTVEYTDQDPTKDDTQWWSIHETDDRNEAIAVAQDTEGHAGVRVRQFQVEYFPMPFEKDMKVTNAEVITGDLVDFRCDDHPERQARAYEGGSSPTCPDCRKRMWPKDMKIVKLSDLKSNKENK